MPRFTEINLATTEKLGYTAQEFTSIPFIELIHPDDRKRPLLKKENNKAAQHHILKTVTCVKMELVNGWHGMDL